MGDTIEDIAPGKDRERSRPDRAGLFMLASEQAGHVTTAQAAAYGVSAALLSYYVRAGTMSRVHHGVYRYRDYPATPRAEVVAAWLAVGKDSAVVSHESALDLWDLTDLIPDAIHLTVPRRRRNLPNLPGVRLHTSTDPLPHHDIRTIDWSLRVTAPQRTLLDVAMAGAEPSQVILGIQQARARGWLDEGSLLHQATHHGRRVCSLVERALASPYAEVLA